MTKNISIYEEYKFFELDDMNNFHQFRLHIFYFYILV